MILDAARLKQRVGRAFTSIGRGTRYRMGNGGFHPQDSVPTRNGFCDCSGWLAWVLGMSRYQGDKGKSFSNNFPWVETSAIYRDAKRDNYVFVEIPVPVPGCVVVYPDHKVLGVRREGHTGLVIEVLSNGKIMTIDCSSSNGGKTKESIRYLDRTSLWKSKKAIFCVLKEDVMK